MAECYSELESLAWPADALPRIHISGVFTHESAGRPMRYRGRTHALHIYEYSGRFQLRGRSLSFSPGDITITPAGEPSVYELAESGRHQCIHFWPAPADESAPQAMLPIFYSPGEGGGYASGQVMAITQLCARGSSEPLAQAAASARLLSLLTWLAMQKEPAGSARHATEGQQAVDVAINYIEANLSNRLTVPHIARHVGLSQNYLARLFKQRTNMTMPGYILRRRIEQANHLLTVTNLAINAVAARVGVTDAQYFNKQFRRIVGCSPTQARKRARDA